MPLDPANIVVKTQQGAGSKSWTAPPLYGGLTTPEMFAFHAEHSPNHPVFAYDDDDGSVKTLRHKDVFRGIQMAAKIISGYLPSPAGPESAPDSDGGDLTVIGILAIADSITCVTLMVGIMYLGHTPFPISARNSAVAVAHLVRKTHVRQLLVSRDAAMQRIAHEAKESLAGEGYEVALLPLPEFSELYNDDDDPADVKMGPVSLDRLALILHSSGSTSFPKPIPISHRNFVTWAYAHYFGDIDICGFRVSMHVLPLYHVMGSMSIPWIIGAGAVMTVFRPSSPPTTVTSESVINALKVIQCDAMICVPTFLETWGRDPMSIALLKPLKFIIYAGAPLSKEIGHSLIVEQGVNILTGYGLTETGAIVYSMTDPQKIVREDWEYFALLPTVECVRRYHDGHPGLFELIILDGPLWSPNVFNTEVDGRPAYATSDFLVEHPTDPKLMKVFGRVDDQIILSTGEKTNPVPMEAILLQDPSISAAIIFGRGRFQNGVLVQPVEPFDPSDEVKLEAFRQKIWPTVERANDFAPSHSRIFKEMIAVTNPSKPFQYTAKGTPRRHISLGEYKEEIDVLYKRAEESSQVDVPLPPSWSDESVRAYIRAVVMRIMKTEEITDEDDLFQQGCDSLQATWIRNTILHALRATTTLQLSVHDLPANFVYTSPSIAALSAFVRRTLSGARVDTDAERAARVAQMAAMLYKYSADFPQPRWGSGPGIANTAARGLGQETVVVTGTTGRLGSHLLAQLLQNPGVVRVYALNRGAGGSEELEERQRDAFGTWGLDGRMLSGGKISFHVVDLASPALGLDETTLDEIRHSVTAILHNAWRVDFQVSLSSFEPLIAGARNVLDLALGSSVPGGPHVLFVSSIASMRGYAAPTAEIEIPESLDFSAEVAVGQGYGESKWVAERVFARAAAQTGLRALAVRVGQLSGDARIGGWSTKEWVPALVRVSKRLGCVPERDDTVSWVPIDTAASALLEMLHSDERILHISAPRPAAWNAVFAPVAERLGVPLVPAAEWLARLRASAREAGGHDAAHSLVDFFEAAMGPGRDLRFATERSVRVAPSLAGMEPLGREDALRWLSFWEGIGFVGL